MHFVSLLLILFYISFSFLIIFFESKRKFKAGGFDFISVFNVLFLLNLVIPPVFLYLFEDYLILNNRVANIVFPAAGVAERVYLGLLTLISFFCIHLGFKVFKYPVLNRQGVGVLKGNKITLFFVFGAAFYLFSVIMFLKNLGGVDWGVLIKASYFRSGKLDDEGGGAFVYAQFLSIALPVSLFSCFCAPKIYGNKVFFFAFGLFLISLATFVTGARRVIMVWFMLLLFLKAANGEKINILGMFTGVILSLLVLVLGENFLSLLGSDKDWAGEDLVTANNNIILSIVSGIFLEIGISFVESLGMLSLYDGDYRYGFDSFVFVASLIPERMLGVDIEWPPRFVRYSTYLLSGDPDEADIPPGFIGYMWVNMGVVGVAVQSFIFGVLGGWLKRNLEYYRYGVVGTFVYILVAYFWGFLMNSGNWEYWFKDYFIAELWLVGVLMIASKRKFYKNGDK